jgi:WD repeat-containing protein 81
MTPPAGWGAAEAPSNNNHNSTSDSNTGGGGRRWVWLPPPVLSPAQQHLEEVWPPAGSRPRTAGAPPPPAQHPAPWSWEALGGGGLEAGGSGRQGWGAPWGPGGASPAGAWWAAPWALRLKVLATWPAHKERLRALAVVPGEGGLLTAGEGSGRGRGACQPRCKHDQQQADTVQLSHPFQPCGMHTAGHAQTPAYYQQCQEVYVFCGVP